MSALIPSSHLLLHDDSISSRVVSWILYLPNSPPSAPSSSHLTPSSSGSFLKGWDPAWGGSLELYPVGSGEETGLPGTKAVHSVPVSWGQLIFFEVQPGRSYHSVEEVIVGDGRQRLGISGWFHRPVEGEEGYVKEDKEKIKADLSSLAQIVSDLNGQFGLKLIPDLGPDPPSYALRARSSCWSFVLAPFLPVEIPRPILPLRFNTGKALRPVRSCF